MAPRDGNCFAPGFLERLSITQPATGARCLAVCMALLLAALMVTGCGGGGSSSSDQAPPPPSDDSCDPATTGLTAPLPACSDQTPCSRLAEELATELNANTLTTPSSEPRCDAPGTEKHTQTVLGFTRYACIYRPPGTSASAKRPLVLWFHPGGNGNADLVADQTHLLDKAADFDLTGDSTRPGFILASVQGRNLRFPTASPRDGRHHDFYYRDLASPSRNPDIANADTLIDTLVGQGDVDADRIYVMGWSNGAFFSQLYGVARHQTATPGGSRVAAAAAFGAGDPFNDISRDPFTDQLRTTGASCQLATYPAVQAPLQLVYRSCDATVACNAAQGPCFRVEPGYAADPWLADSAARGLSVTGVRISGLENSLIELDQDESSCSAITTACPTNDTNACALDPTGDACLCLVNHLRWPDGEYDSPPSGTDREPSMLEFLRNNPL